MESQRITIRIPEPLYTAAAAKAKAAGCKSIGEWLRLLAEKETGVKADPKPGLSGASKKIRKRVSSTGVKARWGE